MIHKNLKKRIDQKIIFKVKIVVKKKLKETKALMAAMFLISIIALVTTVNACPSNRILVIAKGDDLDIAGATTSIIAKIEFDKASGIPSVAQVEFQTKIYDESGEKIYSMKGKLKDGLVEGGSNIHQFYCEVRHVTWINLWSIKGGGVFKTTDADLEIEFRGQTITLPNTKGKYIPVFFWMMVSPKGEHSEGIWPQGGWATVIILINGVPSIGAVTYLTKYMEI